MTFTRRETMAGLVAGTGTTLMGWSPAEAADKPAPLFAGTPLADNRMARHFQRVDMALPDVPVLTAQGRASLSGIGGKTRLVALWAEWCVPCLVEIRDFARLRPQVANDRFDIGLLLSASAAKLDYAGAAARLRPLGAAALPLVVEPGGGDRAARHLASGSALPPELAAKAPPFSFPCTLLVDTRGRVRGRAFGAPANRGAGAPALPALTAEQKAALARGEPVVRKSSPLTQADKDALLANGKTMWASPAGSEFLEALGNGLLDRV